MVRLKHRYILFDILYPPVKNPSTGEQKRKSAAFNKSPRDCLLQLHTQTPATVNGRVIVSLLKTVIEDHFGELASGTVALLIIVKYFSNRTSTGIIRCNRTEFQKVVAALALVTKLEGYEVVMRCVHVSGTIRKCEDFSIRRNRELMNEIGKGDDEELLNELMQLFGKHDDADEGDDEM
ncbi:hypothetical protein PUMCH_002196 [Australozyma saopauloensis]|uniref:Ribonuclease P/MRP protein subunit POP5 n=1 Tax=Australozyma saopauloensis TaxID=291208 RepID=A0AAX4HAK5_9ASCO|nr:hypothetical protein PUMCH_002196 [[Candida] saopauloensis]